MLRDSIHIPTLLYSSLNLANTTIHNDDVSLHTIFISIESLLSLAFIGYPLITTQYAIIKSMTSALLDMLDSYKLTDIVVGEWIENSIRHNNQ